VGEKRAAAYSELNLPTEADRALDRLRLTLNDAVAQFAGGLHANPFVSLVDGDLVYSRDDANIEPDEVGELRRVIETHLRHALARRLFFANQGAFRVGDYEEIMNKARALALLSNAVLVWNTVRIAGIVAALERGGEHVPREHLARISPLANAHVIPSGTYHFERAVAGR
jgi:hypothetical protein